MLANRSYQALIRGRFRVIESRTKSSACMATSPNVAVVSTVACPYCRRAKSALSERGIEFIEIDASNQTELRAATLAATGSKTVPQIFVNGKSIGGCDALLQQLDSGDFQSLVESSAGLPPLPPSLSALIGATSSELVSEKRDGVVASLQLISEAIEKDLGPSFTGAELVKSIKGISFKGDSETELTTAQSLLKHNLISLSSSTRPQQDLLLSLDSRYLIVSLAALPTRDQGKPLNLHYWWNGPSRPATELSTHLRKLILDLFETHLSADGRSVSYKSMSKDPHFRAFVDATAELQSVDLSPLKDNEEELVAFFINLYNALIIHALATWDAKGNSFYCSVKYYIGGWVYSADDIENGVLRGNKPGAANPWAFIGLPQLSKGQFPDQQDPRRRFIAQRPDPRIHFALNCGARSCPPIRIFTPDNLNEGLEAAGESFCSSEIEVLCDKKEVRVSKLFKWYAPDFGSSTIERLSFVRRFLRGQARADLDRLLAEDGGKGVRMTYREYDWTLND